MADKPKGPDAMKDLKWLLYILGGIFVVWIITGGPSRYAAQQPFIKPPSPLDSGALYGGEIGKPTYKGPFVPPASYRGVNTKYFTVYLPAGWVFNETRSLDGYYSGEFTNGTTVLTFDYGKAPSPLLVPADSYTITSERINGVSTKFVFPKKAGDGVTGAYYHRTFGKDLTIAGDNLTKAQQNIAFTIMRTVKFK